MQHADTGVDAIDKDFVPTLSAHIAFIEVENEAVLYDEQTGALHQLDPIAAVVCRCYDGEATVSTIAAELSDVFGAGPHQIEQDVLSMTRHLAGVGVLQGIDAVDTAVDHALDEGRAQAQVDDG